METNRNTINLSGTPKAMPVDVLNVTEGKPERIEILPGDQRPDKTIVARTKCEITFDDEQNLLTCVQALKESDEQMKQRPDSQVLYNWDKVFREGMSIIFGVVWYDRDFFEKRKDAYTSGQHASIFDRFDVKAENFKIEHEVL